MFPIFQKLGGEQAALEILANTRGGKKHGQPPSAFTLRRWRYAGMPAHIQAIIAREAEKRNIRFRYSDMQWKAPSKSQRAA